MPSCQVSSRAAGCPRGSGTKHTRASEKIGSALPRSWLVNEAAIVTGQLINIDGGFLLGRPTRVSGR
jgi:hypothetical protein